MNVVNKSDWKNSFMSLVNVYTPTPEQQSHLNAALDALWEVSSRLNSEKISTKFAIFGGMVSFIMENKLDASSHLARSYSRHGTAVVSFAQPILLCSLLASFYLLSKAVSLHSTISSESSYLRNYGDEVTINSSVLYEVNDLRIACDVFISNLTIPENRNHQIIEFIIEKIRRESEGTETRLTIHTQAADRSHLYTSLICGVCLKLMSIPFPFNLVVFFLSFLAYRPLCEKQSIISERRRAGQLLAPITVEQERQRALQNIIEGVHTTLRRR